MQTQQSGKVETSDIVAFAQYVHTEAVIGHNLAINLSRCPSLNSASLASILKAARHLDEVGRELVLVGMNEKLRTLFDLTQVSRVLLSFTSIAAARHHLQK